MKPIWIVDDDQSIRFVLEKALMREGLPTRSFTSPREVLQALGLPARIGCTSVVRRTKSAPGGSKSSAGFDETKPAETVTS